MDIFIAEFVGTLILILLGDGVVAGVLLKNSKAENSGWISADHPAQHSYDFRSLGPPTSVALPARPPYPQAVVAFDLGESVGKDTPPCALC